jgi:fluoride ion exporter CrcB/FEX
VENVVYEPTAAVPASRWPTFVVNVLAAFLLGYFVTRLQERLPLILPSSLLVGPAGAVTTTCGRDLPVVG